MNTPTHPQLKDYKFEGLLGEGSFGWVWRTVYRGSQQRAVKVFKRNRVDIGVVDRELGKLQLVREHSGIVSLYDFDLSGDMPYYAMSLHAERVPAGDGGDAEVWRGRTLEPLCGAVSAPETVRLLRQIADALAYLHTHRVIHCDVKPSNVLLTDETPPHVKLCDFGQSRSSASVQLEVSGTPFYAPPEQLRHPEQSGPDENGGVRGYRWDVYSFGVLAYKLATGKLPRLEELAEAYRSSASGSSMPPQDRTLHDQLPPEYLAKITEEAGDKIEWPAECILANEERNIVEKCLHLDPSLRWEDMDAVKAAFANVEHERQLAEAVRVAALAQDAKDQAQRRETLFRRAAFIVGGLAICATVLGVFALIQQQEASSQRDAKQREYERAEGERKTALTRLSEGFSIQATESLSQGNAAKSFALTGAALLAHPSPPQALQAQFSQRLLSSRWPLESGMWKLPEDKGSQFVTNGEFDYSGHYLITAAHEGLAAWQVNDTNGWLVHVLDLTTSALRDLEPLRKELGGDRLLIWDIGKECLLLENSSKEIALVDLSSLKVLGRTKINLREEYDVFIAPESKGALLFDKKAGRLAAHSFAAGSEWVTLGEANSDPVVGVAATDEGRVIFAMHGSGAMDVFQTGSYTKSVVSTAGFEKAKVVFVDCRGELLVSAEEAGDKTLLKLYSTADLTRPVLEKEVEVQPSKIVEVVMPEAEPIVIYSKSRAAPAAPEKDQVQDVWTYNLLSDLHLPLPGVQFAEQHGHRLRVASGVRWKVCDDMTDLAAGRLPRQLADLVSGRAVTFDKQMDVRTMTTRALSQDGKLAVMDPGGVIRVFRLDSPCWSPRLLSLGGGWKMNPLWRWENTQYFAVSDSEIARLDLTAQPPILSSYLKTDREAVNSAAGNAEFVVAGGEDGRVRVWEANGLQLRHTLVEEGKCTGLAVDPRLPLAVAVFSKHDDTAIPPEIKKILKAVGVDPDELEKEVERMMPEFKTGEDFNAWLMQKLVGTIQQAMESGKVSQGDMMAVFLPLMQGQVKFNAEQTSIVCVYDLAKGQKPLQRIVVPGVVQQVSNGGRTGEFFYHLEMGEVSRILVARSTGEEMKVTVEANWAKGSYSSMTVHGGSEPTLLLRNFLNAQAVLYPLGGGEVVKFPIDRTYGLDSPSFSADGNLLAMSGESGSVKVYNRKGEFLSKIDIEGGVGSHVFADQGATLLVMDQKSAAETWQADIGMKLSASMPAGSSDSNFTTVGALVRQKGWWSQTIGCHLRCWTDPSPDSLGLEPMSEDDRAWIQREITLLTGYDAARGKWLTHDERLRIVGEVRARGEKGARALPVEQMLLWKLSPVLGESDPTIHPMDSLRASGWFADLDKQQMRQQKDIIPLACWYWGSRPEAAVMQRRSRLTQLVELASNAKPSVRVGGVPETLWELSTSESCDPNWLRYVASLALNAADAPQEGAPREALLQKFLPRLLTLPDGHFNMALSLIRSLNRPEPAQALALCDEAIKRDPNHTKAKFLRAETLMNLGKREEAVAAWRPLLALPEAGVGDFANAGFLMILLKEADEATRVFAEGRKRFPSAPVIPQYEAEGLAFVKEWQKAIPLFQAAASLTKPDEIRLRYILGGLAVCHWSMGAQDKAVECFKEVLVKIPSWADAAGLAKAGFSKNQQEILEVIRVETLKRQPELQGAATQSE